MEQPLDLRDRGQTAQLDRLVEAVEEEAAERSLFVLVDDDPRPLLRALWRKRSDAFDPFGTDIERRGEDGYLVEVPTRAGEAAD